MATRNWLSPKEAAAYLGLQIGALANWRTRGIGPPYSKSGKMIRYSTTDIEAWLDAARVTPNERRSEMSVR